MYYPERVCVIYNFKKINCNYLFLSLVYVHKMRINVISLIALLQTIHYIARCDNFPKFKFLTNRFYLSNILPSHLQCFPLEKYIKQCCMTPNQQTIPKIECIKTISPYTVLCCLKVEVELRFPESFGKFGFCVTFFISSEVGNYKKDVRFCRIV